MPEHKNSPGFDSDMIFLGWQETLSGDAIPLYTITAPDHPLYKSTVSDASLRKLGLRVPQILSRGPEIEPSHSIMVVELNPPKTVRNAIELDGLDYTVVKKPLNLETG
jgi:hypothetical protein